MSSPDQYEDILRKMKIQQEQNKLQQKVKEQNDQKNQMQMKETVKKITEKNSNKNFTYDYDGKIIISKKANTNHNINQENAIGISYKIGTTTSSVQKINQNQPQQVILKGSDTKQSLQIKKSVNSQLQSQSNQTQTQLQNQPSTYDMMLQNLKPSQGVVFKGSKGEIKQGQIYSNVSSQFDFFDAEKNPNDIKRMTKKEYEDVIRSSGNYSRNEAFHKIKKFANPEQNSGNNLNNNKNKNYDNVLEGINISQIQPIEEQTDENLNTQDNKILKRVSSSTHQNKSSLKMARVDSIQRQNSDNLNSKKKIVESNQQHENLYGIQKTEGNRSSQNNLNLIKIKQQTPLIKKGKAGNIQVADKEKLRAMLLS